jgi:hypothetical protein
MKVTGFWDVVPCGLLEVDRHFRGEIAMMMAVRNFETSVYFCETTRRYIPESCHLKTKEEYDCFELWNA